MSDPNLIQFDVRGMPVPQGSAKAFVVKGKAGGPSRAVVVPDTKKGSLAAWRSAIATEARAAMTGAPLEGPVSVRLTFTLPRPASHYLPANRSRPERLLRLDAPIYVTTKPDADKLTRAALDALTAVAYGDDAQVASLDVVKVYGVTPGVAVQVRRLEITR